MTAKRVDNFSVCHSVSVDAVTVLCNARTGILFRTAAVVTDSASVISC